jgi:hypothetical protein
MILSFTIISVLGGLGLLYLWSQRSQDQSIPEVLLPPSEGVYYAECLIEPEKGTMERIKWMIYRRNFVFQVIQENHLGPDIRKAIQSEKKGKAPSGEESSPPEIYRWVRANLFVTPSESVLTLGFAAPQRDLPPKIISGFLRTISEYFRKLDRARTEQKKSLARLLTEARSFF